MITKKWILFPVLIFLTIVSCTKPDDMMKPEPNPEPTPPTPDTKTTYQELLADTLYKLAQQVYYWNTQLPDSATFKPLGYAASDTFAGLRNQLFNIAQIAINPATNNPYEFYSSTSSKYSYINKTSDIYNGGAASSAITNQSQVAELKMTLDGKSNDLGFSVGLNIPAWFAAKGAKDTVAYTNRDSIILFVRSVTNGSPAYNAGLRRGDIIANKELDYNTYRGTAIDNALNGTSLKLILYRPKTKTRDTLPTFSKAVYTFNPVLRDTMISIGSKNIAYIAYQSFTDPTNSEPALDAAFSKFNNATDIVIDLRENGGGYVSMAEYLINLVAPQSAHNKIAFAEHYNQTMQSKQATILKKQTVYINNEAKNYTYYDLDYSVARNTEKINKRKGVNQNSNIKSIYFIVSSNTASASELVINSLKPYFDNVVLIGAWFSDNGKLTYGKPIGFFELRLGKYSVFLSSFETKNATGAGGYYAGFSTNYQEFDDVRYNYGDPNESCFLKAIRLITNNTSYTPTSSNPRSVYANSPIQIKGLSTAGEKNTVKDMIVIPNYKR